jgi:hypothetical protein
MCKCFMLWHALDASHRPHVWPPLELKSQPHTRPEDQGINTSAMLAFSYRRPSLVKGNEVDTPST